MHLELETLLDLYLLQDEFLRGGALRGGEGDEVGAGGEVLEREGNRMILPPLTLPYTSLSRLRLDLYNPFLLFPKRLFSIPVYYIFYILLNFLFSI